jgi:hypothetical protein
MTLTPAPSSTVPPARRENALLGVGLPVWLSFRCCRHGLCGVYVLQTSLLSQERTAELVRRRGLRARVVDFAFLPMTDTSRQERRADREGRADVRRAPPRGVRQRRDGRLPAGARSQTLTSPAREKG